MNQKLEALLKGFRPRFGNTEDINLVARIGRVRKLQETVDKHNARVKSLSRAIGRQTENQKRLDREQGSLIASLEKLQNGTA